MVSRISQYYRYLFFERKKTSGKYLHRLIWIGCISICIPVMLAGLIYYQFSMERIKQQIADENRSSLVMMKERAERILQSIEQESLQLSLDAKINDLFVGRK